MESGEGSTASSKATENGEKRRGSDKTDVEDGPQASKRERADETAGESSQASGGGNQVDNGNCSKDEGESSSSTFVCRSRQNSRNYRRSNDNGNESSSSDGEIQENSLNDGF